MPRVRSPKATRPVAHINLNAVGAVGLQSHPASPDKRVTVPPEILSHQLFTKPYARNVQRQRFGRGLDMDRIQIALNDAYRGGMRQLTDISRETIDVDPHLGSVLNKRLGSVASLPWEVQPAEGSGVDSERAMFYAQVVREQLKNLKAFRKSLRQLAWALFDGRAVLEIKWRKVSAPMAQSHAKYGRTIWAVESLAWVHPRRLSFGPHRQLQIENESAGQAFDGNFTREGMEIDSMQYKFISWMPQLFGEYPEREGLAPRVLYWSFFKRFGARERMMLAELMGKPWRIIEVDQDSTAGKDEMEDADEVVDALGASYTARLPRGTKLRVVQPGDNSGGIHNDIIESTDKQISKLVLGQTGTTDGTPAGLNNNQASVMQDEQLMILIGDAHGLSEAFEELCDFIVALNFGEDATPHAPKFILRSDLPVDRKSELERLKLAQEVGLSIKLDEAYEVSGFSMPDPETDIILRVEQPPTPPGAPNAPNPRPVIVFPQGGSPAQGEQQPSPATAAMDNGSREDATADIVLTASDLGTVITVNEARASQNLTALVLPDGALDPDGDLTIADFKAKKAAATAKANAPAPTPGPPRSNRFDPEPDDDDDDDEEGGTGNGGTPPPRPPGTAAAEATRSLMAEVLADLDEFKLGSGAAVRHVEEAFRRHAEADPVEAYIVVAQDGAFYVQETRTGKRVAKFDTQEEADIRVKQIAFFAPLGSENTTTIIEALDNFARTSRDWAHTCPHVHLDTDFQQQEGATGDPEDLAERGIDDIQPFMRKYTDRYMAAVKGLTTPSAIFQIVNETHAGIDTTPLGRTMAVPTEQSMMMGALDSRAQQEGGLDPDDNPEDDAALATFVAGNIFTLEGKRITLAKGAPIPDFANLAFKEAAKYFASLEVISRAEFASATADVRLMSFTAAGDLSTQMMAVIQAELVDEIARGADLARFSTALEARMKRAGFLETLQGGQMRASHVETLFRTNTMNAYNSGRVRQAMQPGVVEAFPTWEIRTAKDKRVRDSHRRLNGTKLLANDPFWRSNYPPFDYNCRCRVISRRSTADLVDGATLAPPGTGGFVSGISRLI